MLKAERIDEVIITLPWMYHRTIMGLVRSCEALGVRAREKGLALTCEIAADVPDVVLGDPTRLSQILTNLVGNAIKFTEAGRVEVKVVREPGGESDDVTLRFTVSDTGIGVPLEKQELIFESLIFPYGSRR